jgi:glutamyl endopeptidase
MVFSDGRKLTAPEIPVGQELMVAEPWGGSGLSIEELVDQGLIIKSYPDVEALLAKKPVTSGVGIETIIDWDTRMRTYTVDYPARAVVLVDFDQGLCSGWLIGSDTVVTAGHCVHSGGASGDWYTGHTVYPGYDQTVAHYGSCTSTWLGSVVGWTVNQKETYDYGVIKLNCDVGNTTGWFGFLWKYGDTALLNYPTAITGYPGDKPLEQWQSNDKVRASAIRQIFYQNDTVGGMSGSPIWFDKVGPYGIGIHTYGLHGSGHHSNKNHGTRITKGVFNNLLFWINEPK